jgi:hypothetical protein
VESSAGSAIRARPAGGSGLVLEEEARDDAVRYLPGMRLGLLAQQFGFDALIALAAIDSAIEAARQDHEVGGASLSNWLAITALDGTAAVALAGPL